MMAVFIVAGSLFVAMEPAQAASAPMVRCLRAGTANAWDAAPNNRISDCNTYWAVMDRYTWETYAKGVSSQEQALIAANRQNLVNTYQQFESWCSSSPIACALIGGAAAKSFRALYGVIKPLFY